MAPAKGEPDLTTYSGRLAARIRELRTATGMTTEEAAEKLTLNGYGISAPAMRHWENGTRKPMWDALPALAKTFKVKIRELIPEK